MLEKQKYLRQPSLSLSLHGSSRVTKCSSKQFKNINRKQLFSAWLFSEELNAAQSSSKNINCKQLSEKKSIKGKPQTETGASEIFAFVLLRGDSAKILFDRNLEKFQSNEAQVYVWGDSNMT